MNVMRNTRNRKILKVIRKTFGDKFLNYLLSYRNIGYLPDLENPRTFNEKIQWIKLYANLEELGRYVDKYSVRKYVVDTIGEEYLIPLLRVFQHEEDINFNNLPNSFIMKASHTSGYNRIVHDLRKENPEELKKLAANWLKINYYEETGERNYKNIKPSIVIEEVIGNNVPLLDYKIHCFSGVPIVIQVNGNENGLRKGNYYTVDWEKLPFYKGSPNFSDKLQKPNKLKEIITIAKILSKSFTYVRVDLYYLNEKIYFGELTFTPSGGVSKFSNKKYDFSMGSFLELNKDILIR